jgi:D-alanyl-D-alanine dipeptidase
MERGFVFLDEVLRGVRWDAKYATWDNFTGKPVDGYEVNRIVGTQAVALALLEAQRQAAARGFGLLLWDGYRPKRAVACFLRWAKQPESGLTQSNGELTQPDGRLTKERYYPRIERTEVLERGYVAPWSSHSRGSAIDLTLYRLDTGALVSMGGGFDFMDERSHHEARGIADGEARNRRCLRLIMEGSGFESYRLEWWHYVLKDEPYPDTYFDFSVA